MGLLALKVLHLLLFLLELILLLDGLRLEFLLLRLVFRFGFVLLVVELFLHLRNGLVLQSVDLFGQFFHLLLEFGGLVLRIYQFGLFLLDLGYAAVVGIDKLSFKVEDYFLFRLQLGVKELFD